MIPKFLVQFGISYTEDKELRKFARSTIPDDPKIPELRRFHQGLVSYAGAGPNSRDAQLFISYGSAKSLGSQPWETPIGEVVEGMDNVKNFNSEYRETPKQGKIHQGAKYIEDFFPNLDKFETCSVKRMAPEMFIGNKEALDAQETPQGKPAAVGVATGRIGSNTDAADGELTPIIGGIAVLLLLLFAVARRKVSHRKDI